MTPVERIDQALYSHHPDVELEALQAEGLFATHVPEVQAMVGFGGGDTGMKDLWAHTKQVVAQTVTSGCGRLRWAALFHDAGKVQTYSKDSGKVAFHGHEFLSAKLFVQAARRLGFPDKDREEIRFLIGHLGLVEAYETDWTDSAVRRLSRDVGRHFEQLVALARADITTKRQDKRRAHHRRVHELVERTRKLAELDAIPPALPKGLGTAITAEFGIPESKELGVIMKALKAAVEAGELPRGADVEVYLDVVRKRFIMGSPSA